MTVDACKILEEVVNSIRAYNYALPCGTSNTNFIEHYLEGLDCVDCSNRPVQCAKEDLCDNSQIYINCCDLCIYGNNDQSFNCIKANDEIVDVKFISPNNENQCQE